MMKRIVLAFALVLASMGVRAQDCDALVLPFFGNDRANMETYQSVAPEKFELRCAYARAAFYVSDIVPEGADVFQISEVTDKFSGSHLPADYVVDLTRLSFYQYNFNEFQLRYPKGDKTLCFATPGSAHPYLVLRSIEDTYQVASDLINNNATN